MTNAMPTLECEALLRHLAMRSAQRDSDRSRRVRFGSDDLDQRRSTRAVPNLGTVASAASGDTVFPDRGWRRQREHG
jgi:hypothetical protein